MMNIAELSTCQLAAGIAFGTFSILWLLRRISLRHRKADLKDKVVLITGASSGVGEALAHAFYRAGSKVILCARREEQLERVKNDVSSIQLSIQTHSPEVLPLDLEDLEAIPETAKKALAIHGRIDYLVNNGGMGFRGWALSTELSVHQRIMKVNYFGTVALTTALLPGMIERRTGHIIAVSSIQGRIAVPFRSAYSASKHAMQAFFDSLRAEISQHNINVTVISPGYIKTNLSYNAILADGARHGEMDHTTATGMSTEFVAQQILQSVLRREPDVLLAPMHHKLAVLVRVLSPTLYAWIMSRRARSKDH